MFPVILSIHSCSIIPSTGTRFLKGRWARSAIAFYLEYLSSCCVVLTGSQSDSTTILDILCSHYFFVDERPRLKICLILESNQLNLTILRGTLPITPVYSHFPLHAVFSLIFSFDSTWISPLLFYISPLLSCIVFVLPYIPVPFQISPLLPCIVFILPYIPVPSTYTLYSLVSSLYSHISPYPSRYPLYSLASSLYSHISPYLLHIPSTPLYRLCTPIYPRTLPDIPSSYSLVSSLYSHISPYPSTYTLYSLVSSLHSYISLWLFTYPLFFPFSVFW